MGGRILSLHSMGGGNAGQDVYKISQIKWRQRCVYICISL
jgi:hypothetical protein